jgi:hypothetical protein
MTLATPLADVRRWHPGDIVVTRRVRLPLEAITAGLTGPGVTARPPSLPDGPLSADCQSQQWTATGAWRVRAELKEHRRRLVPLPAVEINLAAWSHSVTELRIIPLTRSARWWGLRRTHRYLELVNAAADALTCRCSAPMQATTSHGLSESQRPRARRRDTRIVDNEPGRVVGELALRETTRRMGASTFQGRLCR